MKTKEQKVTYVQKQIDEGFETYYGLDRDEISTLGDEELNIEYDCALNWAGEE